MIKHSRCHTTALWSFVDTKPKPHLKASIRRTNSTIHLDLNVNGVPVLSKINYQPATDFPDGIAPPCLFTGRLQEDSFSLVTILGCEGETSIVSIGSRLYPNGTLDLVHDHDSNETSVLFHENPTPSETTDAKPCPTDYTYFSHTNECYKFVDVSAEPNRILSLWETDSKGER